MLKIKLIDLVNKNVDGIKANIVRQGGKYHYDYQDWPLICKLKKVYRKKVKGIDCIYWEWYAENDQQILEYGYKLGLNYPLSDCGFSGIGESENVPLNEAWIWIEKNPA